MAVGISGPMYQRWGRTLLRAGLKIQGSPYHGDRIVASLRGVEINGKRPRFENIKFIAPNAAIFGDVKFDIGSSAWFGCIIKGEKHSVVVGKRSLVMDNVRIRTDHSSVIIGNNVTICSNTTLNSCTIGDGAFVGVGCNIEAGCVISPGAFVAAGSVVSRGSTVPSAKVWAGSPAKLLRDLNAVERESLKEQHQEYLKLSEINGEHTEKTFREFLDGVDYRSLLMNPGFSDQILLILNSRKEAVEEEESNFSFVRESTEAETDITPYDFSAGYYEPYEHDYSRYPDSFKKNEKSFAKYQEYKDYFEANKQDYPKFIDHGKQYVENKENYTDASKFNDRTNY